MAKMGNCQCVTHFCVYLQSDYRSQGFSGFVTIQIKNKINIHYLNLKKNCDTEFFLDGEGREVVREF